MNSDPTWDDLVGPYTNPPVQAQSQASSGDAAAPVMSRRALRDASSRGRSRGGKPRRNGRGPWGWIIALVVVFGLVIGAGATVWVMYEDKIREVLGIAPEYDYSSTGNGEETFLVIEPGDIGSDVARKLHQAGVTMSYRAFYELLLADTSITFEPGSYRLQKEMSAESALAALQDPANRVIDRVTIPEGVTSVAALELIASSTEISLEELQTEAANFTQFGIPASAPNIEGWMFPATYTFEPGTTAKAAIQTLVDRMIQELDAQGVAPERRFEVLTKAALIQRESGPSVEDMQKIARVFENRLARGMLLQSDATVAYGTGKYHTVWTSPEERADASNPYNTYANPGLPLGPIGLPGADAIDAALAPVDGTWLYFVTVDLRTGETVFSNTLAEHERAAKRLYAWCKETPENESYCA
ncbi:endolytic transglycosylase MltG [Salinibacterium sp. ZJ70]|uniref:endolytic transglycosylase MltG n=1 Tax=Salinibacterium sp. ZJ70 TaxID=2708084 RepID=UPI001CD6EE05|nr:endolytic transglycosylase MltG [Salinibacterium sp. ZJ70]